MKLKNINQSQRFIFEFISISFAVFLGLMLNQWKDTRNNKKLAEQSLTNITLEIRGNLNTMLVMHTNHDSLYKSLDSLLTLYPENFPKGMDIDFSLNFSLISSTSWEAAKLTKAISSMNIELVNNLAELYHFQQYFELIVQEYVLSHIQTNIKVPDHAFFENNNFFLKSITEIEANLVEYYEFLLKEVLAEYTNND